MKVTELIEQMRNANPKLLEEIPDDKAAAIVLKVFRQISKTLADTEEGVVDFVGLGRFRIKKVEIEKAGEKITRTRIIFRMLDPGKERTGGGKGKHKKSGDDVNT